MERAAQTHLGAVNPYGIQDLRVDSWEQARCDSQGKLVHRSVEPVRLVPNPAALHL